MTLPPASGGTTTVLVIEDDTSIRRFLRAGLEGQGYTLIEADNARDGIAQAATRAPGLVLLDLGLPDLDGLEVVKRIREWGSTPIIVLSARGQETDKVRALDAGADDYVTKPFAFGELLARMRVALRHHARIASATEDAVFRSGDLELDLGRRRVSVRGAEVALTPIEYRLLCVLARHAGRVLTHQQLLREVWGAAHAEQRHYLRVYMAQLRHKLESDPARPTLLLTEAGVGYRLAET